MTAPEIPDRIELMGAPGSPYTRKMIAYLRYRRIPYSLHLGGVRGAPEGYPEPKVRLLPTFYFRGVDGEIEAMVDSTPIIRRLEAEFDGRSAIPSDPVLAFLNHLIEDYGDEWLTKAMFHYRWAHAADAKNAAPLLVYWSHPTMPKDEADKMADMFSSRQIDRLYVVGSNETTAKTIEASYQRLLNILDTLIEEQGFVLGARPSSADFAIYGQLTQLAVVEPTSGTFVNTHHPRVRAWIDRLEDLSGLEPEPGHWLDPDAAILPLKPLLTEIGRVYTPFLLANAAAVMAGEEDVETEIDGRTWSQPAFPYQAKCLHWIREAFGGLSADDKARVQAVLDGTGCEPLLG
ncbi:glutathione S-transferase family protein [Parasphingopyxis algicola]|uniref:glutathione S-transferase family protein n=1 Tax=Parasphingopyxis algicola TaxID=2026624 RepID=UPI0015A3B499|nr:glutathione S-transferase family protein [Parasphingopyxis algicola]QLC24347.1 glutathione S-transferase family protein [Parasphingopyxis algicola]